ncbi:MAG TPA: cofactor-independent phosphoglycerate mutase [Mediterranea massiliensis]|uniref:Cofactor-independent phosphoglycerate mutase n=1 Tax=Mediterranea massiliensis TaxID=1841865 RepID=A0A921LD25_9BACT|nr:cofactor-independent phosphoglycerate mutase [Mediterranea massiliensis]MBM6735596.1 cofactor-independent phosphoglycerate mutase [Mediterranea massiliensis]CCZ49035.1 putative homoserine kinase [Bacteroides sp. CAG:661]HJF92723.1 cofactor-independent phosphoglycerate mutase [Mediterranea massiliensis]
MKHIIILGDGMADWPVKSLGGKTLLQTARTPYMDKLARMGRTGRLVTVAEGFHPGSEVANMSVMGYNLPKVYEGRGPLEAASIGVDLKPGEMAMRCNIICIEGDLLKNHSAGHITTPEADVLVKYLQEKLGNERVHFYTGVQYRHLLVIKGGDKRIACTPPHDVPLKPYRPLMVKPLPGTEHITQPEGGAELTPAQTADLINDLIVRSQDLLENHPINLKRKAEGKDPANSIWPWSPGYRPQMESLAEKYPQIRKGAVISAVDLINGIGYYAGLRRLKVEGATGLYDTNYENKAAAALEALKTDDFVYLHVEASDEAGHEGDVDLKIRTIENLDSRAIGPIYEEVKDWEEPVAIAVLPDHPTPCELRTHTAEPVPFLIWYPGIEPDEVQTFDEVAACNGVYGLMKEDEFMNEFMK